MSRGNGYVEEGGMPRLFKQSPLNSIWEGSGNVMCLDVYRAVKREPECVNALVEELNRTKRKDKRFLDFVNEIEEDLISLRDKEQTQESTFKLRSLVDRMGLALLAHSLFLDVEFGFGCEDVLEIFLESRIKNKQ